MVQDCPGRIHQSSVINIPSHAPQPPLTHGLQCLRDSNKRAQESALLAGGGDYLEGVDLAAEEAVFGEASEGKAAPAGKD
jgi:hypothetical protein